MKQIDEIRADIVARLEQAQQPVAQAEVALARMQAILRAVEAELTAHDRAVGAMQAAPTTATATPPGKYDFVRSPRKHVTRLRGQAAEERNKQIVEAYKSGISSRKLAARYGVTPSWILQILNAHTAREEIVRHWVQYQTRRAGEPAGDALPMAAAEQ